MKKVVRSNNAHWDLRQRYTSDGSILGITKWYYHDTVIKKQQKRGKIMSRRERKSLFNRIHAAAKYDGLK